jgi:molybdopterin-guanine dinucleotide biosynthesis adapter protein
MTFEIPPSFTSDSPARGSIRVLGFVGSSGSGKTTLIEQLVPRFSHAGLRVGVMKHAHHGFDLDRPGKDSHRARVAGAAQVLVASGERWALMGEFAHPAGEPNFHAMLGKFDPDQIDVILAEGFSREAYPKVEVHRPEHGQPPRCWPHDPNVLALACSVPLETVAPVAWLDLNRVDMVAGFLLARLPELQPIEFAYVD